MGTLGFEPLWVESCTHDSTITPMVLLHQESYYCTEENQMSCRERNWGNGKGKDVVDWDERTFAGERLTMCPFLIQEDTKA
uniref:Uncharacterized protein n=1 Tax=Arundo donax TaxID=35708 RepID=A0A0A9A4T5_ARUDO